MKILLLLTIFSASAAAQTISSAVPEKVSKSANYLFYLHGGVVTALGNNAISQAMPEWGPYEYLNILDSLSKRGFHVISERRREGIDDSVYVHRIIGQLDTLFRAGVRPANIVVVGASAGWNIGLLVSTKYKNKKVKYVMMGGCWPETYKEYAGMALYGRFLSIIETSDPHRTCNKIFEGRSHVTSYKEIKLNTGLSHGFIYKGYREWIDPVVKWF